MVPDRFDLTGIGALAVTSARIADFLESHPQIAELFKLPVFAVGNHSAQAMRVAGFSKAVSADGDAKALADLIIGSKLQDTVLYLAAQQRAGNLEGLLSEANCPVRLVEIYRMTVVKQLETAVVTALKERMLDGVLIYSRRTAEALILLLESHDLIDALSGLRVISISKQAASPLPSAARIEIAELPTEDSVLARALSLC